MCRARQVDDKESVQRAISMELMSCERLCAYARRKLHHTNCHPSNDASMSESDRRRQSIVLSLWSTHNKIFAISVSLANEVDGVTEWEPALFETSESFLSSLVWMRKFNVARNHDFFLCRVAVHTFRFLHFTFTFSSLWTTICVVHMSPHVRRREHSRRSIPRMWVTR